MIVYCVASLYLGFCFGFWFRHWIYREKELQYWYHYREATRDLREFLQSNQHADPK